MRKFQLVVTCGDPRLGDEVVVFEAKGVSWDSAWTTALKWAKKGYFGSVYDSDGECVDEARPVEMEAT
jgi:hypothetical protein